MTDSISTGSGSSLTATQNASSLASFKKIKQDMETLAQALKDGDLAKSQNAYATLQKDAPNLANQGNSANPRAEAITAIGNALQSGDLSGAQKAFSSMQTAMRGHHHHRAAASEEAAPAVTASSDSATVGTILNAAS